jgi:hypothetical protein
LTQYKSAYIGLEQPDLKYYLCVTITQCNCRTEEEKSETKAVGSTKQYQDFFIWQAIVRGQSVSTEGPFLFLASLICYFRQFL